MVNLNGQTIGVQKERQDNKSFCLTLQVEQEPPGKNSDLYLEMGSAMFCAFRE